MKPNGKPLTAILDFLRRRWGVMGLILLAGSALTAGLVSRYQGAYKTVSKIVCKSNQGGDPRLMAVPELASLAPFLSGGGRDPSLYFEDLLRDPEFLYRILEDTFETRAGSLGYHEMERVSLPDSVLAQPYLKMMGYASIAGGNKAIQLLRMKGSMIQIITRSRNQDGALGLNRRVISGLNEYLVTTMKSQAKQNRLFIETRVKEVASELSESERQLVSFRERNRDIGSPRLTVELANLTRAVSMNQEIYVQLRKQLELSKIEESREMPLIEIISQPQLPMAKSGPSKADIAKIGLFLTAVLSLVVAFVWDWLFSPSQPGVRPREPMKREQAQGA